MKSLEKFFFLFVLLVSAFLIAPQRASADSLSSWTVTSAFPYLLASHSVFTYNNNLYIIGGSAEFGVNWPTPISASIDTSGNVSSWTPGLIPAPKGLIWHTVVIKENRIYVIGGNENLANSQNSSSVYKGTIDNTDAIVSWEPVTSLPKPLAVSEAVVVGDKIYVSGGFENFSETSKDIYYATINSDGTLSSWTLAGQLPTPLFGHGFIESNDYLYVFGGRNFSDGYSANTYRLPINSDGSVGVAESLTPLPQAIARGAVIKHGSKVISLGGEITNGITDKVYVNEINLDGSLGSWIESSNPLPQTICCGAAAVNGDYLYYTGGFNSASYIDTVYFTKLASSNSDLPNLPVNLLKQTSPPWENMTYDTANVWNPANATINRWGCALTSATMILNYHGLTKLNDTTTLDPGSLNTWLKTQNDGYIRNGLINWLAISRLSKSIKAYNPGFTYDALEYKRVNAMDNTQLDSDLNASLPSILEVPGHFIVAKGKTASSYAINDPYYNRDTLDSGYNNEYLSLGRYVPSHTDLSYLMIVVNPDITVTLKKKTGEAIGEEFIQQPINDPVTNQKSGIPLKIIMEPQPDSTDYEITLEETGTHPYQLDIYLYDRNGNVKFTTISGLLTDDGTYTIKFDKNLVSNSSLKQLVSFAEFYRDIKTAYNAKQINTITYLLLTASVKDIEIDYKKGRETQALKKIEIFRLVITKLSKKDAGDPVKQMLLRDLEGLKNFIQQV